MNQETDELYRQKVQKNNSLVTVFMMTHNRVKYLKLAIDSVLRQSYTNFILWIIDNASTDNTKELVSGINDSRVIYSYKDENPFDNMNFAKDVCITPYYIILHDDDIVMDSYLEEALCTIKKYKVDELSVGAYYIDGAGELLQQQNTFSNSIHMYKNDDYFNYFF